MLLFSPTFYEQLLCQYSFDRKIKMQKKLLFEKVAHKKLVKLTPDLHQQNRRWPLLLCQH